MTDKNDTLEKVKKGSKIKTDEMRCPSDNFEELSEYERAKDKGSARLYTSLSRLINWFLWAIYIIFLFIIGCWFVLEYQLIYGDYSPDKIERISMLIQKLESCFSYALTTALGFAGGVCKMFLKKDE